MSGSRYPGAVTRAGADEVLNEVYAGVIDAVSPQSPPSREQLRARFPHFARWIVNERGRTIPADVADYLLREGAARLLASDFERRLGKVLEQPFGAPANRRVAGMYGHG